MVDHKSYGRVAPELGWVPAPRYLLRRHRVLKLLKCLPRGKVLEVGCGAGALLNDLTGLGFDCIALESSSDARQVAKELNAGNSHATVFADAQEGWSGHFDYLLAFEVLEHIEDDFSALQQWVQWLKPSGRLILSVPAHPHLWSDSDVWAGHFRRYRRVQLRDLMEQTGLSVDRIECYGFPLANAIEPIRARFHAKALERRRKVETAAEDKALGTSRSGIERPTETRLYPLLASWPGVLVMSSFCRFQGLFLRTDWGTGYLAIGRRA